MTTSKLAISVLLAFATGSWCVAEDRTPLTFTSVEQAGKDYEIQGEYEGEVGNGSNWGAHVIARGKEKFTVIGYRGGLPGNGWTGDMGEYVKGKFQDGIAKMETPNYYITTDGATLKVFGSRGKQLGELKKVHRKSPTLRQPPPPGATILFDGEASIRNWKNANLAHQKFLAASDCATIEKFGDHHLHLEFRTPFMPKSRGQARGNSGVYLQSRYEVQVLDSFGLAGKDNECGGIYQIAKPKVNMCFPPLAWQTYDIDFRAATYEKGKKTANARVTVRHNGTVIHDDLELPQNTPGQRAEGPESGALFLQDHGNPVIFRNIWVLPK